MPRCSISGLVFLDDPLHAAVGGFSGGPAGVLGDNASLRVAAKLGRWMIEMRRIRRGFGG